MNFPFIKWVQRLAVFISAPQRIEQQLNTDFGAGLYIPIGNMEKITLPFVCFLLLVLVQCNIEAAKTTKPDKGIDFSMTFDGENGSDKGQRQKIHHEKVVDGGHHDNSTANEADGIGSIQLQVDVPLQTAYSPQGGGSGAYGGSAGDSDASSV